MPTEAVIFDVNETLSDMRPLAGRFTDVGAPDALLATWFAAVLRDGFALAATDAYAPFPAVALDTLRTLLSPLPLDRPLEDAAAHVLAGFGSLTVHPDVPPGLRALRAAGVRVATLTNGSLSVAAHLLSAAGLDDLVERRLSVDDAGRWKPHPQSYRWAASQLGVDPAGCVLVAVHPWDVAGAQRVGMRGAWLDRDATPYPLVLPKPDAMGRDLPALVEQVLALP